MPHEKAMISPVKREAKSRSFHPDTHTHPFPPSIFLEAATPKPLVAAAAACQEKKESSVAAVPPPNTHTGRERERKKKG